VTTPASPTLARRETFPAAMIGVRRGRVVATVVAVSIVGAGCAGSAERARGSAGVLRLGVFPTLTHAVAHVGIGSGIFRRALGDTRLETTVLNSGSEASIAMLSGSLDAAFVGSWPAASLYLRSGDVAIVAGAAVGGVAFVVRTSAGISSPADLHGARIAVPNLGNSQDVALRTWLHAHGLSATDEGGDVSVVPTDSTELLQLFRLGRVDAAWVPEPYPTYLVAEGVARSFLDEAELWPDGRFATAGLLVSTGYLEAHPGVVRRLLEAEVRTIRFMRADPARAEETAAQQLVAAGAPAMPADVVHDAWARISFTWAVVPSSMVRVTEDAFAIGLLPERPDAILGVYRLDALNGVLDDDGLPRVPDPTNAEVG
jgi:sulfonate transport system substrate-binding protein